MKKKVIIGVHGLANKPSKAVLEQWWLCALNEGLEWIGSDVRIPDECFTMLYWSERMYIKPQSEDEERPFDLKQTYTRAKSKPQEYKESKIDWVRTVASDTLDNMLDNFSSLDYITDPILITKLKDLASYWDETRTFYGKQTAREFLCASLRDMLRKYSARTIMVIAHSMGSIITFDTLTENLDLSVDTFLTIGSPLGLSNVKRKAARSELICPGCQWPVIPPNIGVWKNFADRRDPVAIDTSLREDYLTVDGKRFIEDELVLNEYVYEDEHGHLKGSPHKSYGYLRCPEISRAVEAFLMK